MTGEYAGEEEAEAGANGSAICREPVAGARLVESDGFWVVLATGTPITGQQVDEIRRGLQR